ncbi:putative bicarbonate transporter [Lupinus albus]|uniref:Putative bicarbonate transporter n=1 Tax=Lupinus albus TaxID=3870 RepID=A0A6A4NRI7_LUPAL|nr:putative bicarbonate transporter [Lupinus albus]
MVEFWTAISFGKPDKVPHGVSRRLFCPLPWEPTSLDHWTLIKSEQLIADPHDWSVIKMILASVLWGYFAYMAIDNLPRNQFWEMILLLFITSNRHYK